MAASEAAVAAVMEALDCRREVDRNGHAYCEAHWTGWLSDVNACPRAERAADAVWPIAQAEALRDYASELDWKQPEKCPCATPEACCGSEESCDAMQPTTRVVGAINLRARADKIERKS
ncbi:MAG: hypothetical protein ACXVX9_12210 [Mycobacteriaceae bacterium]